MGAMERVPPEDFGLTEGLVAEIHARDEKQAHLFARLLLWGCGILWLGLTLFIYARAARRMPFLGLAAAPLLAALGAGIGGLPIAIASAIVSWLAYPRHPKAGACERYEAATAGIRVCEVCLLARGDDTTKEGVRYCARCGAWICPECRNRYDLRAIAALKRGVYREAAPGPRDST
jgi:hypothetical protein